MTFQEFLVNPYDQNSALICLALLVVLVAVSSGITASFYVKKFGSILALSSMAIFIGAMVAVGYISELSYEIDDRNRTIAENNLKEKYDIESVLWNESVADFDDTSGSYSITVQDKDNNILKFRYKINKETREPQLLNELENTQIKSKDLLLNQSK